MSRRTVQLVERRTREVRLLPADVAFLSTHARQLVEVVPAFRRGRFRVTPRDIVGWFDSPGCRFAIRPKLAWPNLRMLLGLPHAEHPGGSQIDPDASLLNLLATEFTERLRDVIRVGLVPGYRECDTRAEFLRGKLRPADQLREAAARAFPDRFYISESVLDLDTPWNCIARAIAEKLLAHPDLCASGRIHLRDATLSLDSVAHRAISEADFTAAEAEARAAHYGPLLAVCRLIHDGLAAARFPPAGEGAFLLDLSRAFERYITKALSAGFAAQGDWSVEAQPGFPVGPTELQPDIVLRKRGEVRLVLDAKWKAPGPAVDDLHQVLAYATVTGSKHVGLVYPGRRLACREFPLIGGTVGLSLYRVPVLGQQTDRWASRLASCLRRRK